MRASSHSSMTGRSFPKPTNRPVKTAVAVYVKYPEPGRVKTRLAADVGPEQAALAYQRMLTHVLDVSLDPLPPGCELILWCDPYRPLEDYRKRFGSYTLRAQSGKDLGERLNDTFATLLEAHEAAITVGSDCVRIEPKHIKETLEQLHRGADLVLGPAEDGGYYLIAMKKNHPPLFSGIDWSTDRVLEQTLQKAREQGLAVHQLERLPDIDTLADWDNSGLTL